MKTPLKLILILALGGLAAGLAWSLLSAEGQPTQVPGPVANAPTTSEPGPPAPAVDLGDPTTPAPPDLAKSFDAFLKNVKVKPFPRPGEVLDEARRGDLGPIDYRMKLEKSLRHPGGPLEGVGLLIGMKDDSDVMRFQTALGLSKRLDDDATRALIDGLPGADPVVRPHMVFALRGSPRPEANQTFVELYTADADLAVRAQAAFVIGERGERLPSMLLERARQTARDDIRSDDTQQIKAGMDVLGTPPLSAEDRRMLERILRSDASSERRLAALQALATAKIPPMELAPLLEHVAADPRASGQLKQAAEAVLHALRNPEPPRPEDD